jgi:hypothetical protein
MPLPQMAKDYFLFNNGSYWVYENTSTNETDSFYISNFRDFTGDNNIFKYGINLNKCYEGYDYKLFSKQFKRFDVGIGPFEPDNNKEFKNQLYFLNEYSELTQQLYSKIYFIGDSIYPSEELGGSISQFDSLSVNNYFYKNILQVTNTVTGIDYTKQSIYAKNIGMIQFTTNDNITWILKRYHIVQ